MRKIVGELVVSALTPITFMICLLTFFLIDALFPRSYSTDFDVRREQILQESIGIVVASCILGLWVVVRLIVAQNFQGLILWVIANLVVAMVAKRIIFK